jgi:DNA polymerase III subunit delta'
MTDAFAGFYGNAQVAATLKQMIGRGDIPQTILLSGPEGIGKATLARRFGAQLLGDGAKIEQDDLSLPKNVEIVEQREKWPAETRNEDPLLFSTHPDFVTFAPDGPLRQLTIPQMRLLRERAQFRPLRGQRRVFLIDHLERANEQAANSLLKLLEEPPEHLVLIATVENLYDLLPTIRSRCVTMQMSRLSDGEMREFAAARKLADAEGLIGVSEGCPGIAATLDLEQFQERRGLMLTALECGAGLAPFSAWVQRSENFAARKSEKLEYHLRFGYGLLEDVLAALHGRAPVRNRDIEPRISALARAVSFSWIERATTGLFDELVLMVRRNIQKLPALDAMIINLRNPLEKNRT